MKSFNLELMLVKDYFKTFILIIIMAIYMAVMQKYIVAGLITSMMILAMRSSSIGFEVEEKSSINNLYGILPVSKEERVKGRFLFTIGTGIVIMLISLLSQMVIFSFMKVSLTANDCLVGFLLGIAVYLICISMQLPGLYKLGAIKGRMFTLIPFVLFFATYYLFQRLKHLGFSSIINFNSNILSISVILLTISILITYISLLISIKICKKKEL